MTTGSKNQVPAVEIIPGLFVPRMAVRWNRCPVCQLVDAKPLLYRQLNLLLVQGRKQQEVVRARVVETTPEAAPYLAGMEAGWTQTLERLEEHLRRG